VTSAEARLTVQAQAGQTPPVRISADPPGPNVTCPGERRCGNQAGIGRVPGRNSVVDPGVRTARVRGQCRERGTGGHRPSAVVQAARGRGVRGCRRVLVPTTSAPNDDANGRQAGAGHGLQQQSAGVIRAVRVYSSEARPGNVWPASGGTATTPWWPDRLICPVRRHGWSELDLPQPLSVESDVAYTISVSTANDPNKVYPVSANFFAAAGGNDKSLTFPAGAECSARSWTRARRRPWTIPTIFAMSCSCPIGAAGERDHLAARPARAPGSGRRYARPRTGNRVPLIGAGTITASACSPRSRRRRPHRDDLAERGQHAIAGPYTLQYGCYGQLCGDEWIVYPLDRR